ncbi:MAG TPA: hypothetical protein PLA94_06715 [Myxococcota bacterium]|nr:hypothetical protein [Myxococcota bacterium]
MLRYQLLGSTRLTRIALPYLLDKGRGKVVGVDPGAEDEGRPWFAPVRGLCRDNGIPIGRFPADHVLDLDPDADSAQGGSLRVRLLAPPGSRSADLNRSILEPHRQPWKVFSGPSESLYAFSLKEIPFRSEEDAEDRMLRATLCGIEVLAEGLERMLAGQSPTPLPSPLIGGRWRPQESFVLWEQPAARVIARIRAAAGPWGGARTSLGETTVWLEDAALESESSEGWLPGTIVSTQPDLVVATGQGLVRIRRLRPGYRPIRWAGEYAAEVGATVGYQLT